MRKERMSCKKARNICIVETLAKFGHFPTTRSEKETWFLSPLRSETQASFKVSLKLNRWFDHGAGKGGNVIDLVLLLQKCTIKEALEYLSEGSIPFSFHPQEMKTSTTEHIEILKTETINHQALVQYLRSRCIALRIARKYCKEVWYSMNAKTYFAIGLKNNKGGWELRNKYFKNSSSPKSITFLDGASDQLLVVEGMFDFLSLATLDPEIIKASDCIVLNSISFIADMEFLVPKYSRVFLFLDNDHAGKRAAKKLLTRSDKITDKSDLYKEYVDLNEKLQDESD